MYIYINTHNIYIYTYVYIYMCVYDCICILMRVTYEYTCQRNNIYGCILNLQIFANIFWVTSTRAASPAPFFAILALRLTYMNRPAKIWTYRATWLFCSQVRVSRLIRIFSKDASPILMQLIATVGKNRSKRYCER